MSSTLSIPLVYKFAFLYLACTTHRLALPRSLSYITASSLFDPGLLVVMLTPSGHIPVLCDSYIPRILTLFLGAPVVLFPPLCFFPHCQFSPFWDLSPETRCGPGEGDPAPLLGPVSGRRSRPPSALLLYALTQKSCRLSPFPSFLISPLPLCPLPHLPTTQAFLVSCSLFPSSDLILPPPTP